MKLVVLGVIGLVAYYAGWLDFLRPYTYRAEVGYYQNGAQNWFVGDDKSQEACKSEALARFSELNRPQGRAFTWSCRKMQGDNFLDRVR